MQSTDVRNPVAAGRGATWTGDPPALTGDFAVDRRSTTDWLEAMVHDVDVLPPRAERGEDQQRAVDALHRRARHVRRRFLARHAEALYDDLTDGLTGQLRVDQLTCLAAERYPALVPDRQRMATEARLAQRHKEGWEIDQGLFLHALLDSPRSGSHLLRSMLLPTSRASAAAPEFRRTGRADLALTTVTRRDGIAYLELCNDAYLNAEDDAAVEALETATDLVLLDDASHVGVLRGAAMSHPAYRGRRVFSAGINLTHLYDGRISLLGFLIRRELGYIAKFVRGLYQDDGTGDRWWPTADKPWVGAVDSFAIGGGLQILPVLDRVVAAEDAWFSLPAMAEGLVPGVANLRLAGLMGGRLSRQMIFWGRRLRVGEPEAALLCDETAPVDGMDDAVRRAAEHLDNPAVAANRRVLNLGVEPLEVFRQYMAKYALEQSYRLYSPDLIANLERTWTGRNRERQDGRRD
ncbi:enoyl-CoA hydratase/isomerase family protein [Micromonospora sp. NPDC018662]|uniref:enoyl-CoA hydratase/isomerase family protein n=1 Tax=Micromonospora sp. NPDC018662 TaxID=3364238 RepID=UPI00379F4571